MSVCNVLNNISMCCNRAFVHHFKVTACSYNRLVYKRTGDGASFAWTDIVTRFCYDVGNDGLFAPGYGKTFLAK